MKMLNIKNIPLFIYHYVPNCPICKSWKTGRYIKGQFLTKRQISIALLKGEYIMPAAEKSYDNCFCGNCGHEWHENSTVHLYSYNQIKEQVILRSIKTARYNNKIIYSGIHKTTKKQQRLNTSFFEKIKKIYIA